MKNFLSWVNEYDRDLLSWTQEHGIDVNRIQENAYRTGVRPAYPEGYIRSQYPDGYFPPVTATALLDLENSKKIKNRTSSKEAP